MIFEANVRDYKCNKKVGIAAFYFLCWEYLLLLVYLVEMAGDIYFAKRIFC